MRKLILVLAIVAAVAPSARAAEGCEYVATGHPGLPNTCTYRANGPGTYEVETLSGFRIMASQDNGLTWRSLAHKTGTHDQPWTAVAVQAGQIDTQAGDLVSVAIGIAQMQTPGGIVRYQDGRIVAHDR